MKLSELIEELQNKYNIMRSLIRKIRKIRGRKIKNNGFHEFYGFKPSC